RPGCCGAHGARQPPPHRACARGDDRERAPVLVVRAGGGGVRAQRAVPPGRRLAAPLRRGGAHRRPVGGDGVVRPGRRGARPGARHGPDRPPGPRLQGGARPCRRGGSPRRLRGGGRAPDEGVRPPPAGLVPPRPARPVARDGQRPHAAAPRAARRTRPVPGTADQRGVTTSPPPVRSNGAVPARTIGRYRVVRLLGTGGFSTVYLARDDRLDADVAIKVLAENWCTDDEISRRFVDEARLLRRCDDDRVVRVHTIEQLDDGRPYFVMDYADAGTLADRAAAALDDGRPFGVREAVALSRELADCLTVVHDNGIVHRDLKPSNVLFRTTRSGERMLLGDFGLARQLLSSTGRTILAGTPEYVAPEQADPALAG